MVLTQIRLTTSSHQPHMGLKPNSNANPLPTNCDFQSIFTTPDSVSNQPHMGLKPNSKSNPYCNTIETTTSNPHSFEHPVNIIFV